jgi:hypothetical protein
MALISGLFLFLILISIGHLTTNETSRLIVTPIRLAAIVGVVFSLVFLFAINKINKKQLLAYIFYIGLVLYGITMSILNGAFDIGQKSLPIDIVVTLVGLTLMSMSVDRPLLDSIAKSYLLYVTFGLVATIAVGGLELNFPPHFVFNYNEDSKIESDMLYSQGISKFCGIGSIFAAYILSKAKQKFYVLTLLFIVFTFLGLSLLGGGRGDSIAAAIIALGFLAFRFRLKSFIFLILISIPLYFSVNDWGSLLDNFIIFQRLASVGGDDLGHRDILLNKVINLLSKEPMCLAIGCGFGYFQSYYNYEFEMYPHNFIAESLIVFGLPMSVAFGLLVAGGIKTYYTNNNKKIDLFILFLLYSALIDMKSGHLFGGWFFTSSSMYLASMYFSRLTRIFNLTHHYKGFPTFLKQKSIVVESRSD